MLPPSKIADRLQRNLHADDIDYGREPGTGVRYITYIAEFTDYKTLSLLHKQLGTVDTGEMGLTISGIEPILHKSNQKIEARLAVYLTESDDRREVEHHDLSEFSG